MWPTRVNLPESVIECGSPMDVLYILLVKPMCQENLLYFTYLSGKKLFFIKTHEIQLGNAKGAVEEVGPKPGQLVFLGNYLYINLIEFNYVVR
jgi:hypothetical protein